MIWRVFIILAWCFISFNAQLAYGADDINTIIPGSNPDNPYNPDNPDTGTTCTGQDCFDDGDDIVNPGNDTANYDLYNGYDGSINEKSKEACKAMGYEHTNRSSCYYKAFPCPYANMWKCDETASVGDIKYSSYYIDAATGFSPPVTRGAGGGWLLADGRDYDPDKYPDLEDVIGYEFGTNDETKLPKLPDYTGVYLRAAGTIKLPSRTGQRTLGKIVSPDNTENFKYLWTSSVGHTHSYSINAYDKSKGTEYFLQSILGEKCLPMNDFYGIEEPINVGVGFDASIDEDNSNELCPISKALYVYIYAGFPAK